jgi:hypothetical protein
MRIKVFALLLSLAVAGCSSGGTGPESGGSDTAPAAESTLPATTAPLVTVPATNPEPGSIVIEPQVLSEDCTKAVEGLRELMKSYTSVLDVPYDGTYDRAFAAGQAGCEESEFRRFHDKELLGWIYAR